MAKKKNTQTREAKGSQNIQHQDASIYYIYDGTRRRLVW